MSFLEQFKGSVAERFQQEAAQKTSQEELRELEQHMLTPARLPPYTGPKPGKGGSLADRQVIFFFESAQDVELLGKHMRVSGYNGNNTRDVALLLAVLEALDRGALVWENDTLYVTDDRDDRRQL